MKHRRSKRSYIKSKPGKPRLSVYKSNANILAQIIDDQTGQTLVSVHSLKMENGGNVEAAKQVGEKIAELAIALNIKDIIFDRGNFRYHGRIKALADKAREKGLAF